MTHQNRNIQTCSTSTQGSLGFETPRYHDNRYVKVISLTNLRTDLLYTREILIYVKASVDNGAIVQLYDFTDDTVRNRIHNPKLVAHRLKCNGPDKLRGSKVFQTHDSQRVKLIN
jgi:hypothetical protein